MNKKILILLLLQFQLLSVFSESISGRMLTPYLNAVGYYDYIVKCKIIGYKEREEPLPRELTGLKIVIVDKFNQNLPDTLWVKASGLAGTTIDYENFEPLYYIVLKLKDKQLYSDFDYPYCMLKIENGKVCTTFTSFDVFLVHLLYLKRYRMMKTEKFEKIVMKRIGKIPRCR